MLSRMMLNRAAGRQSTRLMSSKSALEGDAGVFATRVHHSITTALAVGTPIIFMVPDAYTDGIVNRAFSLLLAVNVSAHSWIGLNYVATDYVPKISKSLVGPSRYLTAGIGLVTLLGLGKMAMAPGGIKKTIKGLWNPPKKEA